MLNYNNTRNLVAVEIFGCLQSWGFWIAIVLVPFLGLILPHPLHLPDIPQWFFWAFWAIMPIKKNLWKRVIFPTTVFIMDLIKVPLVFIVWPAIHIIWELIRPAYMKWIKPYEERLIKPVAIPVFVFLLFYEEIFLWALRKIVFPGVKLFIQVSPAWLIVSIFAVLETGKILAKPLLFVAFGFGLIPGLIFFAGYVAVSFFSLQIMVHGSDKLRSYAWFNTLYEWVAKTIGPIKEQAKKWWKNQAIYHWWQETKEELKKNKDTFTSRVLKRAKTWRRSKKD